MAKFKVRLTDQGPNDKWKTITVEAARYHIDAGSNLHFTGDPANGFIPDNVRSFAGTEWSRVRRVDAA